MKKELLDLIKKIWLKYPDLRLCQLIGNCHEGDGYYIEDKELILQLEDKYPEAVKSKGLN